MSETVAFLLIVLVIAPVLAYVVITTMLLLDKHGAPAFVCVAVPYLLGCGLSLVAAAVIF